MKEWNEYKTGKVLPSWDLMDFVVAGGINIQSFVTKSLNSTTKKL